MNDEYAEPTDEEVIAYAAELHRHARTCESIQAQADEIEKSLAEVIQSLDRLDPEDVALGRVKSPIKSLKATTRVCSSEALHAAQKLIDTALIALKAQKQNNEESNRG